MAMHALFLKFAKNLNSIKITFLIPGHTYMHVDSVHGSIEVYTKKMLVWAPSEWPTVIRNSRINPRPYEVITLTHRDFYDFKVIQKRFWPDKIKKDTTGNIIRYLDIRQMIFLKGSNEVQFKYLLRDASSFIYLDTRGSRNMHLPPLYSAPQAIPQKKYESIMEMCEKKIIPTEYQQEYNLLIGNKDIVLTYLNQMKRMNLLKYFEF
ncbi:unnamed protein product [Psylliodes chrysocephalus]|uniref:Uncharacterized protein n=1 Tax=Psylliodes chrysocephalus TaxID=3402493 RepID=A0A9P0CDY5_9CUCU|nr:unnamed protein product [Psylliodes chrysocephala]